MRTMGLAADSEEKTGTLLDLPNPSPLRFDSTYDSDF